MCYSYRDRRWEEEARRLKEQEARRRQEEQARKAEKARGDRERDLVRA